MLPMRETNHLYILHTSVTDVLAKYLLTNTIMMIDGGIKQLLHEGHARGVFNAGEMRVGDNFVRGALTPLAAMGFVRQTTAAVRA